MCLLGWLWPSPCSSSVSRIPSLPAGGWGTFQCIDLFVLCHVDAVLPGCRGDIVESSMCCRPATSWSRWMCCTCRPCRCACCRVSSYRRLTVNDACWRGIGNSQVNPSEVESSWDKHEKWESLLDLLLVCFRRMPEMRLWKIVTA